MSPHINTNVSYEEHFDGYYANSTNTSIQVSRVALKKQWENNFKVLRSETHL